MNETYQQCVQDIKSQDWDDADYDCGSIMEYVLDYAGNINYYNIDLQCNPPPLCYDFTNITNYLNQASVQQKLGVHNIQWETCSDEVNEMFGVDREESFRFDIPIILKANVRVLVYSGMLDLIW
jgi:carboxypeptidase C (cathepsin A)